MGERSEYRLWAALYLADFPVEVLIQGDVDAGSVVVVDRVLAVRLDESPVIKRLWH